MEYCSICTTSLGEEAPPYSPTASQDPPDTRPLPQDRRFPCCRRIICYKCNRENNRLETYCPYCQISNKPSSLPQGLKDPPLYTSLPSSHTRSLAPTSPSPPPYSASGGTDQRPAPSSQHDKKTLFASSPHSSSSSHQQIAEDTLHFLDHDHDTVQSLSLRYHVPADALRRRNNITSDYLLLGRRTVQIPGEFYRGASLSARPPEGEDEERKRASIRRFMSTCKVHDYDAALFYLEQEEFDLEAAVEAYLADDAWERENPNRLSCEREQRQQRRRRRMFFWRE